MFIAAVAAAPSAATAIRVQQPFLSFPANIATSVQVYYQSMLNRKQFRHNICVSIVKPKSLNGAYRTAQMTLSFNSRQATKVT